jgi:EmrB/QacA subfamily drug resistance transporter
MTDLTRRQKITVISGVMTAMLLSSLDQTIVSTAMPEIVRELQGLEHLSWVFTAYMLASTVTVPIYGKLSDQFGRRGFYLLGIVIFLGGSILCGFSQNMTQLIFFRGIQGIGGGAIMVNSFAIIGDVFPPAERGKWQGIIGAVFGLSSIAGPLIGGWITDNFDWEWVFFVNIPIGIVAMVILSIAMPKLDSRASARHIDFLGSFLITATLVPILLALVWGGSEYAWDSQQIMLMVGGGLLALVLFIMAERKAKQPILSPNLFRNRVFTVSAMTLFLTAMAMFGAIMYIPIFAQGVIGVSATKSGLILTPMMFSLVISSTVTGIAISKTGKYKIIAICGIIVVAVAMYVFSTIDSQTTNNGLVWRMILLGLGLGTTMPIFNIAVQSAFPRERLGEVTAGTQLFRSIGGTVGTAILGGIMNSQLSEKLAKLQNDPFYGSMTAMAAKAGRKVDSNAIQGLLTPAGKEQALAMIKTAPASVQPGLLQSFQNFLATLRVAFSESLGTVYLVGAALMVVAVVVVCFLPEIELRRSNRPVAEEVAVELSTEMGQSDDENEPEIRKTI